MNSILCLVNFSEADFEAIKSSRLLKLRRRTKVLNIDDVSKCKELAEGKDLFLGFMINGDNISEDQAKSLQELKSQLSFHCWVFTNNPEALSGKAEFEACGCRIHPAFDSAKIVPTINDFMSDLVYPELKEIVNASIRTITPNIFPGFGNDVKESEPSSKDNYDILILCDSISKDLFSVITIRIDWNKFKASNSDYDDVEKGEVLEYGKELANGLLGIINYNLSRIDIESRISLPSAMLFSGQGQGFRSNAIKPTIHFLSDNEAIWFTFEITGKMIQEVMSKLRTEGVKFEEPADLVEEF